MRDAALETVAAQGGSIVIHPDLESDVTWPFRDSGELVIASRLPDDARVVIWPAAAPAPEGFSPLSGNWQLLREPQAPVSDFLDYLRWFTDRNVLNKFGDNRRICEGDAMTSPTADASRDFRSNPLNRVLSARLAINWEVAFYVTILAAAFALRFWDLGGRALHHDESIHAQWSWGLIQGSYHHSPIFHGPFYYHVQGLVFLILGANDYTARVSAAIFGMGVRGAPAAAAPATGAVGTMAAVALLAFSPTVVYYSRFFREDIYLAFFTLLAVVAIWRYLEDKRERWIFVFAAAFTGAGDEGRRLPHDRRLPDVPGLLPRVGFGSALAQGARHRRTVASGAAHRRSGRARRVYRGILAAPRFGRRRIDWATISPAQATS